MDEERACEVAEFEAFGDRCAVERESCARNWQRFLPARKLMVVVISRPNCGAAKCLKGGIGRLVSEIAEKIIVLYVPLAHIAEALQLLADYADVFAEGLDLQTGFIVGEEA